MTFLGFKYVGGRNSNPLYLEVKAAAANLIRAKQLPNGNPKKTAVSAALNRMNKAVNKYVASVPAAAAGGPPPPGGAPPPANKNAYINMRPLGGRIGTRQGFRQPNNRGAPIKVPGNPVLQARNKNTVPVEAYKFAGAYYGRSARGVNTNANIFGRRLNIFYKLRAVSDNPPTFRYLADDTAAYKLVSTNGRVTGIEKNESSPFSGAPIQPNFNRWYQGVQGLSLNNRAQQYLNIVYPVEIEKVIVKGPTENQEVYNKRLLRATNITKRAVKFSTMKENDNKKASRANFWAKVSQLEALHKRKNNWNSWFNSVGKFFNNMHGRTNNNGLSNENRQALASFNEWWSTLKGNINTNRRANMFNKARRLPPKEITENNAAYSRRANVLAIVPRAANNTNNTYRNKVSPLYKSVKPYTGVTSAMNRNTNTAKRAFWTAVNRLAGAAGAPPPPAGGP
jgi:hypothetical protein